MPSDPRDPDAPANAALIRDLRERSLLTPSQAAALERLLRSRLDWSTWISRVLLFFGAALLLAGVVFFFAFNWEKLSRTQKFAIVETGIFISAVSAWFCGLDTLLGKVLLATSCVLVGVFLAVFGQIYQTGADTYELFSGWALLILPWVLLGRFGALWILWLGLVNVGLVLYFDQALPAGSDWAGKFADRTAWLAILNAAALAAREWGWRRKVEWLSENWLRWILILAVFGFLTVSMCVLIIDGHFGSQRDLFPVVTFLAAVALGFWIYRFAIPSLVCLAVGTLSVCIVVVFAIGRAFLENAHDPIGVFLFLGIVVLGIFSAAVMWLRSVSTNLNRPAGGSR